VQALNERLEMAHLDTDQFTCVRNIPLRTSRRGLRPSDGICHPLNRCEALPFLIGGELATKILENAISPSAKLFLPSVDIANFLEAPTAQFFASLNEFLKDHESHRADSAGEGCRRALAWSRDPPFIRGEWKSNRLTAASGCALPGHNLRRRFSSAGDFLDSALDMQRSRR
jgi:hypothetical protein